MNGFGQGKFFSWKGRARAVMGTIIALFLAVAVWGCGLKSDPQPRRPESLKAIDNLTAVRGPEGVRLRWSLVPGEITSFKIYRALTQDNCPGCPGKFILIEEVRRRPGRGLKEETFTFVDLGVPFDQGYTWQVRGCLAHGGCSITSNTATLK